MSKVPKLRFKEFSGEWEEKQLNDVSIVNMGQSPDSSSYNEDGIGIPLVQGNADCKNRQTAPRVYTSLPTKICQIDDIIMTVRAPVGAISKSLHNACIGRGVCAITAKEDNAFLYQLLINQEDKWEKLSQGSTFTAVNSSDIKSLKVLIPKESEQQKIASFLSSVDTKIDQLTRKKELFEQYKKALMQKIFSQELRFKADDGSEFPDWEEKEFKDVFKIGSGKDYKHLESGDIPVYGTGGYMLSVSDYLYEGESVCIGRKGTIDKPMFLDGKFWTVDTLFYTHSFKGSIPKFIFYIFQMINWKLYNEASGVPSLSKSTIEKISFSFPSVQEQTKIANFLSAIDTKIDLVAKQLEEVKQFKKGLLGQMFV